MREKVELSESEKVELLAAEVRKLPDETIVEWRKLHESWTIAFESGDVMLAAKIHAAFSPIYVKVQHPSVNQSLWAIKFKAFNKVAEERYL